MEIRGIDVSSYQGIPDWRKIKESGVAFAILRCHQKTGIDTCFEHNYRGCIENGIDVGIYKFSYALNEQEALQEAEAVLKIMGGRKLDFPVFYDLEWMEQRELGAKAIERIAETFLHRIIKARYMVGIYCNVDWYNNILTSKLKTYDCWLAAYPFDDKGVPVERLRPSAGIGWQYSSKGSVPGIKGWCDMDVFYTDWSGNEKKQDPTPNLAEQIRKSALDWMLDLARDDSHGYDQQYRWGERGDYDCSSAVISSFKQADVPLTCTYTGNMRDDMLRHGFKDVTSQCNLATGSGMLPGDVLLNEVHHTAMFVGDGLEVEASVNERGGATGGQPGDQTGREILVRAYRNTYPWDCVLRYVGNGDPVPDVPTGKPYNFTVHTVRRGSKGADVLLLQRLLRGMSFRDDDNVVLVRDGEFGEKTEQALRKFQKKYNLEVDGICGPASWGKMIG